MKRPYLPLLTLLFLLISLPGIAQDGPEAAYARWVAVSKTGNIEALLALASAAKLEQFKKEVTTAAQKAEIQQIMKVLAPVTYTVESSEISPDGKKATLRIEAIALDFFAAMNDPKAKPGPEKMKVTLLQEGGQWKVDQQSSGSFATEADTQWTPLAWDKSVALSKGSFKVTKGKVDFPGAKVQGKAYAVDILFHFPETGDTLSYFFHDNPELTDTYVQAGQEKLAPIAFAESFPEMSQAKVRREVTVMEPNYSYSRSRNFEGKRTVSILFDLPKEAKGSPVLYLKFKYDDKERALEVK